MLADVVNKCFAADARTFIVITEQLTAAAATAAAAAAAIIDRLI